MAKINQKITNSEIEGNINQNISGENIEEVNQEIDKVDSKKIKQNVESGKDGLIIGKNKAIGKKAVIALAIVIIMSILVWIVIKYLK